MLLEGIQNSCICCIIISYFEVFYFHIPKVTLTAAQNAMMQYVSHIVMVVATITTIKLPSNCRTPPQLLTISPNYNTAITKHGTS